MPGISPELYWEMVDTLERCGQFGSDAQLRAVFSDPRIAPWRTSAPEAPDQHSRVVQTVAFLQDQHSVGGESALVLFLRAVADGIDPQDSCHGEITQIVDKIGSQLVAPSSRQPTPFPRFSPRWPFPGLRPFSGEYQDVFFGREEDIVRIFARIQQEPIVIVNGLPGTGKTSLMKAGVMPTLEQQGYSVIYTSVQQKVDEDLLVSVSNHLAADEIGPRDWTQALTRWGEQHAGRRLVLIIDHFEHALSQSSELLSRDVFLEGVSRLLNQPYYSFVHIVIVVQAGWQYSLKKYIEQAIPRYDPNYWTVDVDPLSPEAARRAIVGPLEQRGLEYDPRVVDNIVSVLQGSFSGLPEGRYVHPIQLQVVLGALFRLGQRYGSSDSSIDAETYEKTGGVEHILRTHLADTIGHEAEAWRLLGLFISPDGKTSCFRREAELLAVPAAGRIRRVLNRLVEQGLLDAPSVVEGEGGLIYRLSHECLVDDIMQYITHHSEYLGLKHADEWLTTGVGEWRTHELLLEQRRYVQIHRFRDQLKLSDEARQLVIASALEYGHEGVMYWLARGACADPDLEFVTRQVLAPQPDVRRRALAAITRLDGTSRESHPACHVCEGRLHQRLLRHFKASKTQAERSASAQALWVLGNRGTPTERWQVAYTVFRDWFRENSLKVASYAFTVAVVMFLTFGGFYLRNVLRGSWHSIYSLHAGDVPQLALDPTDSDRLYVVTTGGPRPGEGNSLYVGDLGGLQLVSRGFSRSYPSDIALINRGAQTHIYLLVHSEGVLRSDDGGMSWDVLNKGLPSRGLSSLAPDPWEPDTLYAGTVDWRGVLRSTDAAVSWEFYDTHGEVYGARISRLVFPMSEHSSLLAGTEDGRILAHDDVSHQWVLRFGLPRGGILAMAAAPSSGDYVYAGTSQGIVLRSIDGGESWIVLGQVANEFQVNEIAVHSANPEHLFVAAYGENGNKVWESQDGGLGWKLLSSDGLPRGAIHSLIHKPSGVLIAGTSSGLFATSLSSDDAQWDRVLMNAPLASVSELAVSANAEQPVYAAVGATIYTNRDGMLNTWEYGRGLRAEEVRTVVADPLNPQKAYAGVLLLGEWSVFRTEDGGGTWEQTNPPNMRPTVSDISSLVITTASGGRTVIYAGTLGCGVLRSDDGGDTWHAYGRTDCRSNTSGGGPVDASFMDVDVANPEQLYAATGQWFYSSADGGRTWASGSLSEIGVDSAITGLVADPAISRRVYLITRSSGFWWSDDAGTSWHCGPVKPFLETELRVLAGVEGRSETLLVGGANGGIWMTQSGGRRWRSIRLDLAVGSINSIVSNAPMDGKILIGTGRDGLHMYEPGRLLALGHLGRSE